MDEVLLWVKENLSILLSIPALSAVAAFIANWFVTKQLPKFKESLIVLFSRLLSNMFGISYDDGKDLVESLPFVEKFDDIQEKLQMDIELKLFELKQKLASPVYTAAEKVPIQAFYDYLYQKAKDSLSPEAKEALETIENMTKQP